MVLDIVIVVVLGFGFYRGFSKGFVLSIFSFIAWIVGLMAALKLTDVGSGYLREWFDSTSPYIPIVSFVMIFLAVVVIVILFAKVVDKIITVTQLGLWNKLAGGFLEMLIFLLVLSVVFWLFQQGGVITPQAQADSKLYGTVATVAPGFFNWLGRNVPALKDLLDNLKPHFNRFNLPQLPDFMK